LNTKETRNRRPLVLVTVLTVHAGVILLLIRAAQHQIRLPATMHGSSIFLVLPQPHATPDVRSRKNATPRVPAPDARSPKREPAPEDAITVTSEERPQPKVDWEQETDLTVQNVLANTEKQHSYRDLSALTRDQLEWIKKNHMEPMPPGFHWHHRRVEFDSKTVLPIFWINDYCVLIGVFPFCRWGGKIQQDGTLFDRMRDPGDP
jgi:hypothetical protein